MWKKKLLLMIIQVISFSMAMLFYGVSFVELPLYRTLLGTLCMGIMFIAIILLGEER